MVSDAPRERRSRALARLAGARVFFCVASLAVMFGLEMAGRGFPAAAQRGVHATLVGALVLGVASRAVQRHTIRLEVLAGVQLFADVVLVSLLVHFTGGGESVFTPLYVLVVLCAASLFDRPGAYSTAAASAAGFGAVLLLEHLDAIASFGGAGGAPLPVLVAHWAVHTAAMLIVALLASVLLRDLRRAGEDLARSRSDLRQLRRLHERTVDSLLSGLLTTDDAGLITSFNPEAEHITGRGAHEAIGVHIDELLPGARERVLLAGEANGARTRARMPYVNRSGQQMHLGIAGSILRGADGAAAGHVLIFQDVTDVVRMDTELRRAERLAAVGQLSADIAHEIRNPLAAISGSVQMLQASADPDGKRLMNIVLRETDRLTALLTDFLQYARPGPARFERVAVSELFEDMAKMITSASSPGIVLRLDAAPDLAVSGDPAQLRQLLWNLCRNAEQAMGKEGTLTLEARCDDRGSPQELASEGRHKAGGTGPGDVEIIVRDSGPGIRGEVLERIFDPFFTTKSEGTGLGLATVHRIVEGHGGSLRVETQVGRGTAFRVRLPRHRESA